MISDYLNKMIQEENSELKELELQLNQSVEELKYAQEWLSTLQLEENRDTNIFSPRSIDTERKQKIVKAQDDVRAIEQKIEYTRELIETKVKSREEHQKLLEESEYNTRTENNNDFMKSVYQKLSLCLALVDSDKNKCKSELRKLKDEIKKLCQQ